MTRLEVELMCFIAYVTSFGLDLRVCSYVVKTRGNWKQLGCNSFVLPVEF